MKEDVLEQVVDDYLRLAGYFTRANIRYKPASVHPEYVAKQDSVASDIDVLGVNPLVNGAGRVWAVSCKSWQDGMAPMKVLNALQTGKLAGNKRPIWRYYREVGSGKWNAAFRERVEQLTGAQTFRFSIAVTRLALPGGMTADEAVQAWRDDAQIGQCLSGIEFSFLPLADMWAELLQQMTTTPEPSEMGRLAQVLRAAGVLDSIAGA